jgi:uncharacterized membrane protein
VTIVETIAAAVKPWNEPYSHSKAVSASVTFVHLGSLLLGGGFAVASDRAALRVRTADVDERRRVLRDFAGIHRPVVTALGVMIVSGLAMMLADVETFLVSPVYWTKMALFVVLLANGYLVMRTEQSLTTNPSPSNPLWGRFTMGAVASLTLWLTTTLIGVILMSAA